MWLNVSAMYMLFRCWYFSGPLSEINYCYLWSKFIYTTQRASLPYFLQNVVCWYEFVWLFGTHQLQGRPSFSRKANNRHRTDHSCLHHSWNIKYQTIYSQTLIYYHVKTNITINNFSEVFERLCPFYRYINFMTLV